MKYIFVVILLIEKSITNEQKKVEYSFQNKTKNFKSLDYVSGWFMKASLFCKEYISEAAFVSTNSICQSRQVGILWNSLFKNYSEITFAKFQMGKFSIT